MIFIKFEALQVILKMNEHIRNLLEENRKIHFFTNLLFIVSFYLKSKGK